MERSPLSPCLPAPRHTHTQSRPCDSPLQHQVTTPTPTRTYSSGACPVRWAGSLRMTERPVNHGGSLGSLPLLAPTCAWGHILYKMVWVFSQKLGIISYLSYTVSYQRWYEIFDCFSLMPDSPQSRGSLYPICFASHRALSQLTSPCDHSNLTRPLHTCCGYLLGSAARQPISIAVPVTSCCNPVTSCSI